MNNIFEICATIMMMFSVIVSMSISLYCIFSVLSRKA